MKKIVVDGIETNYGITTDGKIYSYQFHKFLAVSIRKDEYCQIRLTVNAIRSNFRVHRLVAEAYLNNPNKFKIVNHINNIRSDNRVENLEWCTQKINVAHTVSQGRQVGPKGESCARAKLKDHEVLEIRKRYSAGGVSQAKLANEYKVAQIQISRIVTRKTWIHI